MSESDPPHESQPADDTEIDLTAGRSPSPRDLMELLGNAHQQTATQSSPQQARAYGDSQVARPVLPPLAPWLSADFHRPRNGAPLFSTMPTTRAAGPMLLDDTGEIDLVGSQSSSVLDWPDSEPEVELPQVSTRVDASSPNEHLVFVPSASDRPGLLQRLREQLAMQIALRRRSGDRDSDGDDIEVVSGIGAPAWIPRRRGVRQLLASLRSGPSEDRFDQVVVAPPHHEILETFNPTPVWDDAGVAAQAERAAVPLDDEFSPAAATGIEFAVPAKLTGSQGPAAVQGPDLAADEFEEFHSRPIGDEAVAQQPRLPGDVEMADHAPAVSGITGAVTPAQFPSMATLTAPQRGADEFEEFHPVPVWESHLDGAATSGAVADSTPEFDFEPAPVGVAQFSQMPPASAEPGGPHRAVWPLEHDLAAPFEVDRRSLAWLDARFEPEVIGAVAGVPTQVVPHDLGPAQADSREPHHPLNHERSVRPTARFPNDALRPADGASPLSAPRDLTGRDRSLHFVPAPVPSRRRPVRPRDGRLLLVQDSLRAGYHTVTHLPLPTLRVGSDRQWRRTVGIDRRAAIVVAVGVVLLGAGLLTGRHVSGQPTGAAAAATTHTPAVAKHPAVSTHPLTRLPEIQAPLIGTSTPSPPTEHLSLADPYTLGSGGRGDSVESVVYGIHPNDFRIVIQMTGASSPSTVTGLENPTTLVVVLNKTRATDSVGSIPTGQEVVSAREQTTSTPGQIVYFFTLANPLTAQNISQYYLPSPERLVIDLS